MPRQRQLTDATPAGAAAVEEGCACGAAFLEGCAGEAQAYVERLAADGRAAFKSLEGCRGPMDLLAVQQAWALSRFEAVTDTTWRLWGAVFGSIPAAAASGAFRLPD